MSALREQILARVAALLTGTTPAGVHVYRSREVSITRAQTPAITVLFDGENTRRMSVAADQNEMTVLLAIFVRGDPWDQIATAVDEVAHRLLMQDAALALLISDLQRTGADPESNEADLTAGSLNVRYRVTFLTRRADLTLQP